MAISPPSDILLDVATAADPAKVRAATQRLSVLAADPAAQNTGFSEALARAKSDAGGAVAPSTAASLPIALPSGHGVQSVASHGKPSAYRKLEAVLLQSFVESMLPKDDELFGDKNSAGVYRSMMAEQLGNQLANAGGIGLAKAMEAAHPPHQKAPKAGQA